MRQERWVFAAALGIPLLALSLSVGCKRNYPSSPVGMNTHTLTPGTPSATPTRTRTPTMTRTHTNMYTSTPTYTRTRTLTPTETYSPTPIPPPIGIDNLEDNDILINDIPGLASAGSPGSWFILGDPGCTSVGPSPFVPVTPGAGGAGYAIKMTGTGCTTFGAQLGFNFNADTSLLFDVSLYTGVRFDIRRPSGLVSSVRYSLVDYPNDTRGGCSVCDAFFGQDLVVDSAWQPVTVFWSAMNRPSWYTGGATYPIPDIWECYGMQWQANAPSGNDFDIEVDNVAFVYDVPPPTPTPDCRPVDNMEDNNNQATVFMAPSCGSTGDAFRGGYWYTFTDNTGELWPLGGSLFTMSSPGAGSSNFAARFTGTGHTDWGAGLGLNLTEPKAFYDLSCGGNFTGIRFYARVSTGAATSVRFKIPTAETDPAGNICQSASPDDCPKYDDGKEYNNCCYDDFGIVLTLTDTWMLYDVPFSSLTTENFGYQPPGGFNPAAISALQWQFGPGTDFDMWVDDIVLY